MPFFCRLGAGCAGKGSSGSDTFCLLGRLANEVFAGSGSGSEDGSRAGTFRFREEVDVRAEEAATGPAVSGEPDGVEEFAALAALRVILGEGMSIGSVE